MNAESFLGRIERREDRVWPLLVRGLAATLNIEAPTNGWLPPLWHWMLFQEWAAAHSLGNDGHPQRGGFLPDEPSLPRRMWAGGRLKLHRALQSGAAVWRTSTIRRIEEKRGSSGRLLFVTVSHEIADEFGVAISEEQDLVYRAAQAGESTDLTRPMAGPGAEVVAGALRQTVNVNSTLLFRYSALTGNGHRIHYDQDYAQREEGYGSLVVHGPLQATLLAGLVLRQEPGRALGEFAFRGRRPALLHNCPLTLETWCDAGLWRARSLDRVGTVCMTAEASFAP